MAEKKGKRATWVPVIGAYSSDPILFPDWAGETEAEAWENLRRGICGGEDEEPSRQLRTLREMGYRVVRADQVSSKEAQARVEEIVEKGTRVFSVWWDSGGPGGGGCDSVYRHRGKYATITEGEGQKGPFDTLEEAIEEGFLSEVTPAVTDVTSCDLSAKEIAALVSGLGLDEGHVILFNDQPWEWTGSRGFVPAKPRRADDEDATEE